MKRTIRFTGLCLLPALLALAACSTSQTRSTGDGMDRSEWVAELPEAMSEELCEDSSRLRQCFQVSQEACSEQTHALTASCSQQYQAQMPRTMRPGDTQEWGERIGTCAGEAVFTAVAERYELTPSLDCQQEFGQVEALNEPGIAEALEATAVPASELDQAGQAGEVLEEVSEL